MILIGSTIGSFFLLSFPDPSIFSYYLESCKADSAYKASPENTPTNQRIVLRCDPNGNRCGDGITVRVVWININPSGIAIIGP